MVPDSFRSEALAEALSGPVAGRRVLLARADRGRTVLLDDLRRVAEVEQVAVYRNADADELPAAVVERIERADVDWITLTSSAIAERLHALLPERGPSPRRPRGPPGQPQPGHDRHRRAVWAGPVAAEAAVFTWDGLVRAMVECVAADPSGCARPSHGTRKDAEGAD